MVGLVRKIDIRFITNSNFLKFSWRRALLARELPMVKTERKAPHAPARGDNGPAQGPLESLAAIKAALSKATRTGWDDSTIGARAAVKAAQPSTQSLAQAYVMKGVARPGDIPQTTVTSNRWRQKVPPLPGKRSVALPVVPLATGGGAIQACPTVPC